MAGNLYKRGKVWWVRFTLDGIERRKSLRTVHVAEARVRAKKLKADAEEDSFWGGAQMPWEVAMMRYRTEVLPTVVKANTAKRYEVSLRMVSPYLQGKPVHKITARTISEVLAARRKERATNATLQRDLTAMSRVFVAARSWGACEHNPARDYDREMVKSRTKPIRLPTNREVVAALQASPTALFRRIMRFAGLTGMRQSEVLHLQWRQVDLGRAAISLDRTKTDVARAVPLTPRTLRLLTDLPHRKGLVFAQDNGQPYRNFPSQFSNWRKRNKVPFKFHDLRHRFAVMYLRGGGSIYTLQQILGHASIKTTEIYLDHLTPNERTRAQNTAQV